MKVKNEGLDPNTWLLPETAARFTVVGWNFGPLVHCPAFAHLGHPNGRVNLKDLKPAYAEQLVQAGFPYLRRKAAADVKSEKEMPAADKKGPANNNQKSKEQ